jgi:hypothetical protein
MPAISIVVGTVQGWPEVESCLETWQAATAEAAGELIVLDGSGLPPPPARALGPRTRWESQPGQSVFQLRRAGYRLSRAPIVAMTEDHCRVPRDWGTRFIEVFAREPHAAAVGGSVENGATSTPIDWASFLVVQAMAMSPIASGRVDRLPGAVNVAYRREALESLDDHDGLGVLDVLHQRSLRETGAVLVSDDSIRVVHDQSLSTMRMSEMHFHAGRTFASFLRRRPDWRSWTRFAGVLVLPYARFGRTLRLARQRGYGDVARLAWPQMLWLLWCQAAGQLMGFVAGPGDSPRRLH